MIFFVGQRIAEKKERGAHHLSLSLSLLLVLSDVVVSIFSSLSFLQRSRRFTNSKKDMLKKMKLAYHQQHIGKQKVLGVQ